jgi:hypothetical protein
LSEEHYNIKIKLLLHTKSPCMALILKQTIILFCLPHINVFLQVLLFYKYNFNCDNFTFPEFKYVYCKKLSVLGEKKDSGKSNSVLPNLLLTNKHYFGHITVHVKWKNEAFYGRIKVNFTVFAQNYVEWINNYNTAQKWSWQGKRKL